MKCNGSTSVTTSSPPGSAALPAQTIPPYFFSPQSCSPALLLPPCTPALPAATELLDPAHQSAPCCVMCEESLDEDDFTSMSCPITPSPAPAPVSVPPVSIPPNVSLIGTQAFHVLMKQPNMQVFKLCLSDVDVHTRVAQASIMTLQTSSVSPEHRCFLSTSLIT